MAAACSAYQVTQNDWALSLEFDTFTNGEETSQPDPVSVHFVVDNSISMGNGTKQAQDVFSEMVDSVATAPCSFTVFGGEAKILSSNIASGKEMRALRLPMQGLTNIPGGITKALGVIRGHEIKSSAKAKGIMAGVAQESEALATTTTRTHHILVLLSDGDHNSGPTPETVFPTLSSIVPEGTKISVIVVGYTRNSNTSMGMLLKKSVETVPFSSSTVQTIYFVTSRPELQKALASIETNVNQALKGTFHEIKADTSSLVEHFGSGAQASVRVHLGPDSSALSLLYSGYGPPESLMIDGKPVPVDVTNESIAVGDLSQMIQRLIDRTKIHVVASKDKAEMISKSVARLNEFVKVLEGKSISKSDLKLDSISPKERIKFYRDIRATCHRARELRNQILDIANFSDSNSDAQASFLNGRSMKFANKALLRAAKTDEGFVDPKTERKSILKGLTSSSFTEKLKSALVMDTLANIMRLSDDQVKNVVIPRVRAVNPSHALLVTEIHRKVCSGPSLENDVPLEVFGMSSRAEEMVRSGTLADYLNDICHGRRQSYLSLSSPWQHLEEWTRFGEQPDFESTWEMLMYAGFVGYPIIMDQRSSGCQMNPYLLSVKGVRHSLADTASMCCANQAEIAVYGPEGGEPIQDILVLIDPSMPRASKMICCNTLLGEKFTSATIARDLQMYTGINMRIALHSNALFHLTTYPPDDEAGREDDAVADLRRAFLGRAFMCPQCGFGPVDHFACSDLMSHHGEHTGGGVVVNNACPRCTWFSSRLFDWEKWDGTVCREFLESNIQKQRNGKKTGKTLMVSEAKIDMILRIIYSLRKMCDSATTIKEQYAELAEKMAANGQPDLSTKAGIDGMSQVLLALMNPFAKKGTRTLRDHAEHSAQLLLSIVHEDCVREARNRFRGESAGSKEIARKMAVQHLERLLTIEADTAPNPMPQMESEPPVENVRIDCDDSFQLHTNTAAADIRWVRGVARKWCRAWSFVGGLCHILENREGGWDQLDRDMETDSFSYQDVIESLKNVEVQSPREVFGMEEGTDIQALFLRIGVSAILTGVAKISIHMINKGDDQDAVDDVVQMEHLLNGYPDKILHDAARELRMLIYMERVRDKMAVWKVQGEKQTFFVARAADIGQYSDLVNAQRHVHSLDKPTFWGLWNAAKNTKNKEKMTAFLSTANAEFAHKHL